MSAITTSVIDISVGTPGVGIPVSLERKTHSAGWQAVGRGSTDIHGRVDDLLSAKEAFLPGHYRLIYEIGPYFLLRSVDCLFPQVTISFVVRDAQELYHIPLLLSPFGYSTFRGT